MTNDQQITETLILRLPTWNAQPHPLDLNTGIRILVEARALVNDYIAATQALRNAFTLAYNVQVRTSKDLAQEQINVTNL